MRRFKMTPAIEQARIDKALRNPPVPPLEMEACIRKALDDHPGRQFFLGVEVDVAQPFSIKRSRWIHGSQWFSIIPVLSFQKRTNL